MDFRKLGVMCLLVSVFLIPTFVSAHATPSTYTPSAGSTELQTPSSISIRFTERIEVGASSLTVFGPTGAEIQENKGVIDPGDDRVLSVPVRDDGEGMYTISWQVVSVDDGHFTKGAYSFLVDATGKVFEGDAGTTEVQYSSKVPDAILSFFNLLGESVYIAVLVFLCILQRLYIKKTLTESEPLVLYKPFFTHALVFSTILFVSASSIAVMRKTLELASLQELDFFSALALYLQSSVGTFSLLKVVVALFFLLVFFMLRKKIFTEQKLFPISILMVLLGAILYMQSYISHAAASFFYPQLSVFVTFIHLATKESIIGGLVVLCGLLFFLVHKKLFSHFVVILRSFNFFATVALFGAVLSGVYVTWLHLKHFENFFVTEWGVRFVMLLCLTVFLGSFRLLHQLFITEKILVSEKLQKLFAVTLPIEVILALLVLFYSGYIAITTPPFIVEQYTYSTSALSQNVVIALDAHPYEDSSLRISLTDSLTHEALLPKKLVVTATNPEFNVGPNVLTLESRFDGGYVFSKEDLTPHGLWNILVVAEREDGYDARATFEIVYPEAVTATKISDDVRHFDSVAVVFIGIGIFLSVFCVALCFHAYHHMRRQFVDMLWKAKVSLLPLILSVVLLSVVTVAMVYGFFTLVSPQDFKSECLADGQLWRQAYPTRYFEPTSKNTFYGCFVHEGHFHFVDQREYEFYMRSL